VTTASIPERLDLSFTMISEADAPPGVAFDKLEALATFVLSAEGATGLWEVTVALVDDVRLQSLHRDFMGLDTPTDIMTFPNGEPAAEIQGGELVISVDHAITQSVAWGLSPSEEIEFLTVHGLLHLCDWRDDTDEQRERMLSRQHELIDQWRRQKTREGC
jgi:rRNA maturation RNase YbeY